MRTLMCLCLTTRACAVVCVLMIGLGERHLQAGQDPDHGVAVAMVARVTGDATVRSSARTRTLRLFDRVLEGDVIRTDAGAHVLLVFRTGARTRIGASSEGRVRAGAVLAQSGVVEALASVPTIPLVAPVAGEGRTITAVRIRAHDLDVLTPAPGETVMAGEALVLTYGPDGAEEYTVEVERPDATIVFQARTADARASVPAGRLDPGRTYRWRVTARWPSGFTAGADGTFHTLPVALAIQRDALRAALSGPDAESLALLGEVDYSLGLWRDAWRQFTSVRSAGVRDQVIDERLADLTRRFPRGIDEP